jgi:hypothetical protein
VQTRLLAKRFCVVRLVAFHQLLPTSPACVARVPGTVGRTGRPARTRGEPEVRTRDTAGAGLRGKGSGDTRSHDKGRARLFCETSEKSALTNEIRAMPSSMASSRVSVHSVNGTHLAQMRCRAAKDKLRIVNEAIKAHEAYLESLDLYELEVVAWNAKRAPLEAEVELQQQRVLAFEHKKRLIGAGSGVRGDGDDDDPNDTLSRLETHARDARAALFLMDSASPVSPKEQDNLNEPRVALDGTEGGALFLLCCGVSEGLGDVGVSLVKQLLSRGANVNSIGDRPSFGKKLTPLALALASLEGFVDPGDSVHVTEYGFVDSLRNVFGRANGGNQTKDSHSTRSRASATSQDSDSVSGDDSLEDKNVFGDDESPRSVGRLGSEKSWDSTDVVGLEKEEPSPGSEHPTEVLKGSGYDDDADGTDNTAGSPDAETDFVSPNNPPRVSHLKNLCAALLAGGACFEWSAPITLRPYTGGRNASLAKPFRDVTPFRGARGTTTTSALFQAAAGAIHPNASLDTRNACVDIAARLLGLGASCNTTGCRPGKTRTSGADLAPLALLIAAMETETVFSVSNNAEYDADAIDGNPTASAAALLLTATKKQPHLSLVDVDAVTLFTHVPSLGEYRRRRVVCGDVDDDASTSHATRQSEKENGSPETESKPNGPHLWHAVCAAAEGAGSPAVAVALKLLNLGANANGVGSRPGHCGGGTYFPPNTFRLPDCPYSYQKGLLRPEGTIPSDCYPDCLRNTNPSYTWSDRLTLSALIVQGTPILAMCVGALRGRSSNAVRGFPNHHVPPA